MATKEKTQFLVIVIGALITVCGLLYAALNIGIKENSAKIEKRRDHVTAEISELKGRHFSDISTIRTGQAVIESEIKHVQCSLDRIEKSLGIKYLSAEK